MVSLGFESQIVVVIGLCLVSSYLLNLVLNKKFKLPLMIAPLIVGLLLNYNFFDYRYLVPDFRTVISVFANMGVAVVLFFIGLKVDLRYLKDLSRSASVIALSSGLIPFLLGSAATFLYTGNLFEYLFVGVALAITAEEVSVGILDELKMLKKRIGQLILDAGIIGDIFEISIIALLGILIRYNSMQGSALFTMLLEIGVFLAVILLMRYFVIDMLLRIAEKTKRGFDYFGVALITLLVMTVASELLNFSMVLGALLAAILLKDKLVKDKLYYEEYQITEALEVFNFGIFHPIIFIWIGLSIDFSIIYNNIGFGLLLTFLALGGKLLGSVFGNYLVNEPASQGMLIGWGLNARGATGLFALLIAKNVGLVSLGVFSAIVFMALVTTIISPVVFKMLAMKGYGIVNHANHYKAHRHRKKVGIV